MRQPSINPPSFYDDVAPPPLLTPPPNYDDLTPRIEVRDGYFDESVESGDNSDEVEEEPINNLDSVSSSDFAETESMIEGSELEEDNIVDMVGLEDLSLNVRGGSPMNRRSVDMGIYAS
jgi:hypothetical protein